MKMAKKAKLMRGFEFAAFVLPAFILVVVLIFVPFVMNLSYSLTDWNGISSKTNFIGLDNFKRLFGEKDFWSREVVFTLKYLVGYLIGVNVLGFLAALFLARPYKAAGLMRGLFFLPYVMSLTLVGYVWKFVVNVGFDSIYQSTGIEFFQMEFFGDPSLSFYTLLFVAIWYGAGYYAVIYVAGLKSMPKELLEAADIDGAGKLQKLWYIKFPLLAPSFTVCLFVATLGGLNTFELPLVITNGGPAGYTTSIALSIYQDAYVAYDFGYAIAKSIIFFVMVMFITLLQLKFTKKREVSA